MKEKNTLSGNLYELTKQVIKQLKEKRDKKEMVPVKYPYLQAKISDFKYEKGTTGYATSFEKCSKERWDDRSKFDFVAKSKELKEYKETLKIIAEILDESEGQSDFWLDRFVHRIIDESLHGIDEKDIVELVTLFIFDLEHTPIQLNPVVWLNGIYMETDMIEINKNFKIKKPEPSDLEYKISYDIMPVMGPDLSQRMPSAIMLIRHRAKGQPETLYKIQTIISTFRLFRVGSVIGTRTQWNPITILGFRGTTQSTKSSTPFKYGLDKNDEQKLRNFFGLMEPIVSSQLTQKKNKEENFVTIAFDRYNNALEEKMPESRLTYGTMCLEALYLEGEMELTRRLSQRVACAMSFFGYKPLDVFNTMKKSYAIRSRFVHGSKIEKNHRKNLAELEKELMDYARVSIIIFLQLQGNLEKDDFLSKLDTSLLDEKAKKELNDFLKEKCQIIQ